MFVVQQTALALPCLVLPVTAIGIAVVISALAASCILPAVLAGDAVLMLSSPPFASSLHPLSLAEYTMTSTLQGDTVSVAVF